MQNLTMAILIPTFKRANDLYRCLEALKLQERMPDEVVITVRDIDNETIEFLEKYDNKFLNIKKIIVYEPGVISAMNAGISVVDCDITVLTDDDTAAYPDWLRLIEDHFNSDETIGAVGGRDHQKIHPGSQKKVGILQYTGRIIGNHHLGVGPARPVDILKGANSAYRTEPLKKIGFDKRLLGEGAQVNWELGLGLAFKRAGWKLIYDPAVQLDHFVSVRHTEDQFHRGGAFNGKSHAEAVHNETIFLWEHFDIMQRAVFLCWFLMIGTRSQPGLVQVLRLLISGGLKSPEILSSTLKGRFLGIRNARLKKCVEQ
jgi:cellulose synthase/poly-beta-1,6-N-acetylglucosamine synthase-like glycosyltransferase